MNAEIVARLEKSFDSAADSGALHALALRLAEAEAELAEERFMRESQLLDAYTVASTLQKYYLPLLASNDLKVSVDLDELSECMELLEQFETEIELLDESGVDKSYEEFKAAKKRLAALKPKRPTKPPKKPPL